MTKVTMLAWRNSELRNLEDAITALPKDLEVRVLARQYKASYYTLKRMCTLQEQWDRNNAQHVYVHNSQYVCAWLTNNKIYVKEPDTFHFKLAIETVSIRLNADEKNETSIMAYFID